MSTALNRRRFTRNSLATAAGTLAWSARAFAVRTPDFIEAVVVGSGFGGSIAALRLAQAGIETLVLERGRRWPITEVGDTFSSKEAPDGRSTWLSDTTILPPPIPAVAINRFVGVLDRIVGNGITAFRGAGVGGGSLVYGGINIQPTKHLFYKVFPRTIDYDELNRVYFPRVRSMLNATPIPDDILQTDAYVETRILLEQAARAGLKTIKPAMAINWDIVRQEIEGKKVGSIIAGEVYYGTNSGAKNSLDHNYLPVAEATGCVEILPLHMVTSIEEADRGLYRVVSSQINEQGAVLAQKSITCRYLFLAAGSLGTPELLLRAQSNGTLRNLSDSVGRFWGPNSDSSAIVAVASETNPTLGSPGVIAIEHLDNPISPILLEPFQAEPSIPQGAMPVLGQGISKPEGFFTFNAATQSAELFWPSKSADSQKNARALALTYQLLNEASGTSLAAPIDQSSTAHPVGGAVIGAVCNDYGEVFGYQNLFVVDGSLVPGSTGCANPSFTIAALAERSMDRILNRS
jgi:cholesterol oxidase